MSMIQLTQEILEAELANWMAKYGRGRDENDIRFGQHIWNTYDMPCLGHKNDGFYAEEPEQAFQQITDQLNGSRPRK